MNDAMRASSGAHGGISARALVWIGLATMLAAQLANAVLVRAPGRFTRRNAPASANA